MRHRFNVGVAFFAAVVLWGCAKTISTEKYVKAMSDLGCKMLSETDPKADEVLKSNGVSREEIQTFRKKTEMPKMIATAEEIAARVAACHGAPPPP